MSIKASVKITLELTIPCDSHWGDGTTIDQVKKQALSSAEVELRKWISKTNNYYTKEIDKKVITLEVIDDE